MQCFGRLPRQEGDDAVLVRRQDDTQTLSASPLIYWPKPTAHSVKSSVLRLPRLANLTG
jgi:hypothetical protein